MIRDLSRQVVRALTDDLRRSPWRGSKNRLAGHCYVACEAIFHLSGKTLRPHFIRHEGSPHWFLRDASGQVVDPTFSQFKNPVPYHLGRGKGFLTKSPSKRAATVMARVRSQAFY